MLAQVREGEEEAALVESSMGDLRSVLGDRTRYRVRSVRLHHDSSGFHEIGVIYYVEKRRPAWTVDPTLLDVLNQLIVLARRGRLVALYCSDQAKRQALSRRVSRQGEPGLGKLEKIPASRLNAAFVSGSARTLWLTGTHTRVSVKADNKVLTGIDLRDALDPLEDQTFHFTSARCLPTGHDQPIGTSPRSSSVWQGRSRSWEEFAGAVVGLFENLEGITAPIDSPFPVLAVEATDPDAAAEAFDISILPAELIADTALDAETRAEVQVLSDHTAFEILETEGASARTRVRFEGSEVGEIEFTLSTPSPGETAVEISGEAIEGQEETFSRVFEAAHHRDWLMIRYESGHTLVDGAIYEIRHRDLPFDGYEWIDLRGFAVTKEKPSTLSRIGEEDSLFCWVQQKWRAEGGTPRGWLACDDGSMEIADFIHVDAEAVPPLLSLIHVKGAKSGSTNRGLSVSAYEVVTAQAVKNLRHLDRILLDEALRQGLERRVGSLVWNDGRPRSRNEMLDVLSGLPTPVRQVVILQPHLTSRTYEQGRTEGGTSASKRLVQLDTLLLAAEASCHGLGSRLVVLGADSP
jgi:hypothetical protein